MTTVGFIYNAVPDIERSGVFAECASMRTIDAIGQALTAGGSKILPVNLRTPQQLAQSFGPKQAPEYAFVIAEGYLEQPATLYDGSGAAMVRHNLDALGVASSHSSAATMELCRQKDRTYEVLQSQGIRCPQYVALTTDMSREMVSNLVKIAFPLFLKPTGGGNSVGIDERSRVESIDALMAQLAAVRRRLGSVAMVAETYLPGEEYTVGVIGNECPIALPPVTFEQSLVRTNQVKKLEARNELPVRVVDQLEPAYASLREIALAVFAALGCRDVVRVDFRADAWGNLCVIDVNGTPSLAPTSSLTRMGEATGMDYSQLINLILGYGLLRTGRVPGPELAELIAGTEAILAPLQARDNVA